MNTITIKQIESADVLKDCAAILVEAYNAPPWNDNWTIDKATEKLQCFYHSPKFYGIMAYDGDTLLGCCVGNVEPYYTGDYFYLKEMFVSVQAQRKGIGKQLMASLKTYLDTIAIDLLSCLHHNHIFHLIFILKLSLK